jgi:hypothetical protein
MSPPPKLSRRTLTIGGLAAAGAAAVAGAVYEVPKLFKRRAHGEYADLVNRLEDPAQAAVVGRAVHDDVSESDLKKQLAAHPLPALLSDDSAHIDRMAEAGGWVIPATLAELCVLAARSV